MSSVMNAQANTIDELVGAICVAIHTEDDRISCFFAYLDSVAFAPVFAG